MDKRKLINTLLRGSRSRSSCRQECLRFATGEEVLIEIVDDSHLRSLATAQQSPLAHADLHEVVAFLYNAGQNWKRPDYVRRTVYESNLTKYLGYSPKAAQTEADWIALLLCSSFRLFDILAVELGAWQMLDNWIAREESLIRAFPRGKVLHLVPGNVPLSAVVSLLRAVVTKNTSIVKVSAGDPFTAPALLQSFADIDAKHPVTTSISTVYWPTSAATAIGAKFAEYVNTIVAWGGKDALAWARKCAGPETEIVEFGPKRSIAVIGPHNNTGDAARGAALDISLYDQKACFSTRQIFVHRSCYGAFRRELALALEKLDALIPTGKMSIDEVASRSLTKAHAGFLDALTTGSASTSWSIIDEDIAGMVYHPLARTVFLTPFDEPSTIYDAIDSEVQTVAVFPWEYCPEIRDECARRGAARIVECGLSNVFRVGGSHDGIYPLQRLVRIVSNELPSRIRAKGINVPINQTEFIEHNKFLEFAP